MMVQQLVLDRTPSSLTGERNPLGSAAESRVHQATESHGYVMGSYSQDRESMNLAKATSESLGHYLMAVPPTHVRLTLLHMELEKVRLPGFALKV